MPLDVVLPVRRGARDRGEDAAAVRPCGAPAQTDVGAQVVLKRQDRCAEVSIWQGANVAQIIGIACKLQVAIGADNAAGKGLVVHADREWERNTGSAIIAMVA